MHQPTGIVASIRPVGRDGLARVMPVMRDAFDPQFGEAWTEGQCLSLMLLPGVWLSLASDSKDEPLGFTLNRITLDEAELLLIGVRKDARGRGVGRQLLAEMMTTARERGASQVFLEVRDGNPARKLYEACGFVMVGRRRAYYTGADGQTFDALTFRRMLD